ncbi:DUF397 domain-containing protein [Lentzea cavernae]|uniref:DUF397 domain-containing protein n=1 Tax=Lentzea cavernae TaxID=2020703 RepID=UPI00174E27A6|nr:DUF397 domain-containing protein [Lentzea cavernae]
MGATMTAELRWIRSSYSSGGSEACVEFAADAPTSVLVRDSKDGSGSLVRFSSSAWTAFVRLAAAS